MQKFARKVSLVMVALFTMMTLLAYVPQAQAASLPTKLTVKMLQDVQPTYKVGERMYFKVNVPAYSGKVEYRATLWDGSVGKTIEVFKAYPYYYKNWQPAGKSEFYVTWIVDHPATYNITLYARPVGSKLPFAGLVKSSNFTAVAEETTTPQPATITEVTAAPATVNEGEAYTLPAQLDAKMSDGTTKKVDVAWTPATVDTKTVGDATFTGKVAGYDKEVKLTLTVKAVPVTATVAASTAKSFKVVFNKAVDTTKAVFTVKKSNVTQNASSITWNDAKTEATLSMVTKMTAGDYVVGVTGLGMATESYTVKVENEKIGKIEFPSSVAVLQSGETSVTAFVNFYNQYNEKISNSSALINDVVFTPGIGNVSTGYDADKKITISNGATKYVVDQKLALSVLDKNTNTFASTVLTVGAQAIVSDITIKSLYNEDGDVPQVGLTPSDFKLLVEAKDQYGNPVPAANIASDVIISVSGTNFTTASTFVASTLADGTKATTLSLTGTFTAGTTRVTIVPKTTGRLGYFDVEVKDAAKVDTLTLTAPELVAAGETFEITYSAVDQFGQPVTSLAKLQAVNFGTGTVVPAFTKDYVKNVISLKATAPATKGTVIVLATTPTGKFVQLPINVVDGKNAMVVTGLKDFTPSVALNGKLTLKPSNLTVIDQYSRTMTPALKAAAGGYRYVVSTEDASIVQLAQGATTGSSLYLTTSAAITGGSVDLKGLKKGSTTITVKLEKWNATLTTPAFVAVTGSDYSFTATVASKADYTSYEAVAGGKIYTDSTHSGDYDVALTVYGVKADGSKIALPYSSSYYTVTPVNPVVQVSAAGELYATTGAGIIASTAKEANTTVVVTVNANGEAVVVPVTVTVSNATPVETDVYLDNTDTNHYVDATTAKASVAELTTTGGIKAVLDSVLVADDQYGVTLSTNKVSVMIVTNVPTATSPVARVLTGTNLNQYVTGLQSGDTFNVTVITLNGITKTIKFIVK